MQYSWGTASALRAGAGAALLALLCCACSGGAINLKSGLAGGGGGQTPPHGGPTPLAMRQTLYGTMPPAAEFSVLPATFAAGGTAQITTHSVAEADGRVRIDIAAQAAQNLRALVVAVDFDTALWHSDGGQSSSALAAADTAGASGAALIQLTGETHPGHLEHGEALAPADAAVGFSGSATLATLWLARGPVRQSSTAATDTMPLPEGVAFNRTTSELSWAYSLAGDYDQNGDVNSSDIVPLARYFKQSKPAGFTADTIQSVVDGDRNGEVGLGDLTVIGQHLGAAVQAYQIYASADFAHDYPGFPPPLPSGSNGFQQQYMFPSEPSPTDTPSHLTDYAPDFLQLSEADRTAARVIFKTTVVPNAAGTYLWLRSQNGAVCSIASQPAARPASTPLTGLPEDYGFSWDAASATFSWFSVFRGDYDNNGEIDIADLNPLAQLLGSTGPWQPGTRQYVCDGNGDLTIDWRDAGLVALNFHKQLSSLSFGLFYAPSMASVPSDPDAPETKAPVLEIPHPVSSQSGPDQWQAVFSNPPAGYYYVRAKINGGAYATRSTAIAAP